MIRNATAADIDLLTTIYNSVVLEGGLTGDLEPQSVDNRRSWFLDHQERYAIFVKVVDGSIAGYAAISPYRKGRNAFDETCELSYYLSKSYRGRGLGKELVSHAIREAGRSGFRLIVAIVLGCNHISIDLLIQFGFSILGRLPDAAKINAEYFDHVYLARSVTLDI